MNTSNVLIFKPKIGNHTHPNPPSPKGSRKGTIIRLADLKAAA